MKVMLTIALVLILSVAAVAAPWSGKPALYDANGNVIPQVWTGSSWVPDSGVRTVAGIATVDTVSVVVSLDTVNKVVRIDSASAYITNWPAVLSSYDTHVRVDGGWIFVTNWPASFSSSDTGVHNYFNIGTDSSPEWSSQNWNSETNPIYVSVTDTLSTPTYITNSDGSETATVTNGRLNVNSTPSTWSDSVTVRGTGVNGMLLIDTSATSRLNVSVFGGATSVTAGPPSGDNLSTSTFNGLYTLNYLYGYDSMSTPGNWDRIQVIQGVTDTIQSNLTGMLTSSRLYGYNRIDSVWDRFAVGSVGLDNCMPETNGVLFTASHVYAYDPNTSMCTRLRGDTQYGLDVDITRMPAVTIAGIANCSTTIPAMTASTTTTCSFSVGTAQVLAGPDSVSQWLYMQADTDAVYWFPLLEAEPAVTAGSIVHVSDGIIPLNITGQMYISCKTASGLGTPTAVYFRVRWSH